MSLKLPRLPQYAPSHAELQIWWQQVCEAIEGQEIRQDELLAEIEETQADLANAVEATEDVLVRLFDVEELADGTIAIVDQGLEADGTVKEGKVNTRSVQAEAISAVEWADGADTAIPGDGSEVVIITSPVFTVGDDIYGGALCEIMGQFDGTANPDSAANFFLETNANAGGWVRQKTAKAGARTDGADTFSYQTIYSGVGLKDVGLETVQVRLLGQAFAMPGSSIFASTILEPAWRITPLKR